jgi:hypothetical protein
MRGQWAHAAHAPLGGTTRSACFHVITPCVPGPRHHLRFRTRPAFHRFNSSLPNQPVVPQPCWTSVGVRVRPILMTEILPDVGRQVRDLLLLQRYGAFQAIVPVPWATRRRPALIREANRGSEAQPCWVISMQRSAHLWRPIAQCESPEGEGVPNPGSGDFLAL